MTIKSDLIILDEMAKANEKIFVAPKGNVIEVRRLKKDGWVKIGLHPQMVNMLMDSDNIVGMLVLADKKQFFGRKDKN